MGAAVKTVKCIKCNNDMQIKSFRIAPGKHVFGKGFICEACLKKDNQKADGNGAAKKTVKAAAK